jgi:hypothetical protein
MTFPWYDDMAEILGETQGTGRYSFQFGAEDGPNEANVDPNIGSGFSNHKKMAHFRDTEDLNISYIAAWVIDRFRPKNPS